MPLYRGEQADHLIQDAIVLDLGDLRRQAEQLKARAREQADQIVAEGRAEAERLTANAEQAGYEAGFARGQPEGYQQGLEQGHAEAVANAREQLAQIADAWIAAGQQWDADRRQMLLDARQSMLELALEIAQRVVKRVPQVDPTVVEDQLAAAIDQMARPADVRIRIHPDDRPLIEEAMPRLAETYESLGHAHLIDDEAVERGGCVLGYARGRIDATLQRQLDRIVQTLLPDRAEITADAAPDPSQHEAADEPGPAASLQPPAVAQGPGSEPLDPDDGTPAPQSDGPGEEGDEGREANPSNSREPQEPQP